MSSSGSSAASPALTLSAVASAPTNGAGGAGVPPVTSSRLRRPHANTVVATTATADAGSTLAVPPHTSPPTQAHAQTGGSSSSSSTLGARASSDDRLIVTPRDDEAAAATAGVDGDDVAVVAALSTAVGGSATGMAGATLSSDPRLVFLKRRAAAGRRLEVRAPRNAVSLSPPRTDRPSANARPQDGQFTAPSLEAIESLNEASDPPAALAAITYGLQSTDTKMLTAALNALMRAAKNAATLSEFVTAETILLVMSAFRHSQEDSEVGCLALNCMRTLATNDLTVRGRIVEQNGIEMIVNGMRRHRAQVEWLTAALRVVQLLAGKNKEGKKQMVSSGLVALAIKCSQQHAEHSAELAQRAAMVIAVLATGNENIKISIGRDGGIPVLLAACRAHAASPAVVGSVCRALAVLSENAENQNVIAESGGLTDLATALRAHPLDAELQRWAIIALGYVSCATALAGVRASETNALIASTGIAMLLASMQRFESDTGIQQAGCLAIAALCQRSADNRVQIASTGGIDLVLRAMDVNPRDADIQKNGCRALNNLTILNASNRAYMLRAGAVAIIQRAKRAHRTDVEVQQCVVAALKQLS